MVEIINNQAETGGALSSVGNQPRPGLMDRVDKYYAEKNDWKKMNGACPISTDIRATLELLRGNVPAVDGATMSESLPEMVRASVLKFSVDGQTFEQIWSDKISEGANSVRVVDGVFGFYRGEEKLNTSNKPLEISAMPAVLELREKERVEVMEKMRAAREEMIKKDLSGVNVAQLESGANAGQL